MTNKCDQVCFVCRLAGVTVCPDRGGELKLAQPVVVYRGLTREDRKKLAQEPKWGVA